MKRFWLGVGLFLVLLSSSFTLLSVLLPSKVHAAGYSNLVITANFVDSAHIDVKITGTYTTDSGDKIDMSTASGMYYDRNLGDNGIDGGGYAQGGDKKVGVTSGCQSSVFVPGLTIGAHNFPAAWSLSLPPKGTTATQCIGVDIGSKNKPSTTYTANAGPMGDGGRADIVYYVSDLTHMNEVDNDPTYDSASQGKYTLTKVANGTSTIGVGDKFLFDKEHPDYGGRCPNYIQVTGEKGASDVIPGKLYDQDNAGQNDCKLTNGTGNPLNEYILVNTPTQIAQGNSQFPSTGGTNDTGGDPNVALQDKCPLTEWWQLKWIACPIIESINGFINDISKQIQESLLIDVDGWFGNGQNADAIKAAFNSFRAIGLSILIAAAVAMIASQASGFEALDALTIRRSMPQFVVAVILISILWPVEKAAVQIINELSLWIPDAMYAPFLHIRNDINAIDGWSLLTALLAAVGGLVALGPFGFLSFLVTAFFALVVAAITITIVKMSLLGALIVLPAAIAFRPIPNLKFIWEFVIKIIQGAAIFTILVPIAFALGKILAILLPSGGSLGSTGGGALSHAASIFADTSAAGGFLRSLGVFACIIGPYIAIPKIAQSSLGAVSQLTGIVNDRSRGAFDRLKKYRQGTVQQRARDWKAGSLYQDKGIVRSRINNLGRRAALGRKGFMPNQGNALLAMQQAVDREQAGKENPLLGQLAMEDDANAVLGLSGGSRSEGERMAEALFGNDMARRQAAVNRANAVGFNRKNAAFAFNSMMQNKARAVGAGRIDLIESGAANLAGGNNDLYNSLMYEAAYNARGSGRNDLGGVSIATNEADARRLVDETNGLVRSSAAAGTTISNQDARSYLTTMDGMARTTVGQMMNGHTNQATADTSAIQFMMQNGSIAQRTVALQRANEIAKNLSQANGDSQNIFNQFVHDIGIDSSSAVPFSRQLAARSLGVDLTAIAQRATPGAGGAPTYTPADQAMLDQVSRLSNQIENGSRTYGNENAYRQGQMDLAA